MGFPNEVREKALIACKRHCVLFERSLGVNFECLNIIPRKKGGPDTFDNCIPLCFECHANVGAYNPDHPKGNKYSEKELKTRRDNFYQMVAEGLIPRNNVVGIQKPHQVDINLFEKIQSIFQSPNLLLYLKDYDLGNDFDNKIFWPLAEFEMKCQDPSYAFINHEMESYKQVLFNSVRAFTGYKAVNTFPTNMGTQALRTYKNYKFTDEERRRERMEFNQLATDVFEAYNSFVINCRRILYN